MRMSLIQKFISAAPSFLVFCYNLFRQSHALAGWVKSVVEVDVDNLGRWVARVVDSLLPPFKSDVCIVSSALPSSDPCLFSH